MSILTDVATHDLSRRGSPAVGRISPGRHLIGPWADFLLLGGGSIIPLLLVTYLWPSGSDTGQLLAGTLLLANLINHPHFAHSYQLFYRNFIGRAFRDDFPPSLRRRYCFAAFGVPLLLVSFFTYCLLAHAPLLLGKAVNLMLFLVGWHYVKQGYGMLMVDSALKHTWFDARQKQVLLWNAYAVWITSWLLANRIFAEKNMWELKYYTFGVPEWALWTAFALMAVSSVMAVSALASRLRDWRTGNAPINGCIAYLVSLYLWLLVRHPAMLLVIPAFHSLQYLAVVWRYRLNMEREHSRGGQTLFGVRGPLPGFTLFVLLGIALGYFAFWRIPFLLNAHVDYDRTMFGSALFLLLFWVFINIHHYFLDNVMWRRDNPDTRRYLFGAG